MALEGTAKGPMLSARMRLEVDHMKYTITRYVLDAWESELEPVVSKAILECLGGYETYIKQEVPALIRHQIDDILRTSVKAAITDNWNLRHEIEDRVKLLAIEEIKKAFEKEVKNG